MRKYQLETLLKKAVVLEAEQQGERLNKHPDTAPIPKEAQERFDTALYGTPKQKRAHRIRTVTGRVLAYGLTGVVATAVVLISVFLVGRGTKDMQVTPVAPVGTDAPPAPGNPADTAIAPPTAWGHTPSPTAASDEVSTPELGDASAEQWTDNGIDGIGVVRGNTNGNLHSNHGRALCDGNNIYYIDQESDPVRICKYNLSTKETQVLVEFKDETSPMNIGYLNLIGTDLYYAEGIYTGQTQSIYRISTIDLRSEKIYETTDLLFHLFAAYDRLFITDMQGILICDLNGKEINRIDGYYLSGMMDGILYAYRSDADGCYAMDLNGTVKDFYDTVVSPIPINGYLVDLDNLAGEPLEYKGNLTVVNAANHESRSFEIPEIGCASYWNISKDAVYLQKYGYDETGEIYRMDWYGNGLSRVDDRIFYTGVSLWEDRLLADMVPCDPYYERDGGSDLSPEIGVWDTDDLPFLYLELFDDGTARILEMFGDTDIRTHYAWNSPDGERFTLTFSDQTVIKTAEWNPDADTMTLTTVDGSTVEAERKTSIVLPLLAADANRKETPIALPAVCPAYALGTSKEETMEGILFRYDLDGDGKKETISFRQSPDDGNTPVVVCIDDHEYPLQELDPRDKVTQAILLQPDSASEDLALVLTTDDIYADWNETEILLLQGREVREIKAETNDAYAYLSDGTLRITARCWLMGTYFGSRAYVGKALEPESEWYETRILDRVKDWTREKQIELNYLFKVVRDLPCTIDGKPAVIKPGTWVYLLRWKDTDDAAEIMTEDGRIARLAFTPIHPDLDGQYIIGYAIDGVDAETYFDNLCMAG